MLPIEKYPKLCKQYPALEFIGDILSQHFCHWFDLEYMEGIFSSTSSIDDFKAQSYGKFFDVCMNSLKDCLTEDEVVPALNKLLNLEATIDQHFFGNYLLVPNASGKGQRAQLGFLEKMAAQCILLRNEHY